MERGRRARSWVLAFAPVVALAGALVAGAVVVDSALQPVTIDSSDRVPTDPEPAPSPSFDIEPFIVQVQPIEDAPLGDDATRDTLIGGGETVVDSTYLGSSGGWFAVGWLTDNAQVCMTVTLVDRSVSDVTARGICSNFEPFLENGLIYDGGYWSVTWLASGQVSWQGLDG